MVIALEPSAPFEVRLDADEKLDETEATIFECVPITVRQQEHIANEASDVKDEALRVKAGSVDLWAIRCGLRGVRQFWTEAKPKKKGQARGEVAFETTPGKGPMSGKPMVSDKFLSRLTVRQRKDLAEKIMRAGKVTEEEAEK